MIPLNCCWPPTPSFSCPSRLPPPSPPSPQIEVIQKSIEPFATLWRFCSEAMRSLPEWMDGPFPEIDPEVVANECDKWWRGTAKLAKTLTGGPLEVVTQVRGEGGGGEACDNT